MQKNVNSAERSEKFKAAPSVENGRRCFFLCVLRRMVKIVFVYADYADARGVKKDEIIARKESINCKFLSSFGY